MRHAILAATFAVIFASIMLYGCIIPSANQAASSAPAKQCKPSNESAPPQVCGNITVSRAEPQINASETNTADADSPDTDRANNTDTERANTNTTDTNVPDTNDSAEGNANFTIVDDGTNGTASGNQSGNQNAQAPGEPSGIGFGNGRYLLVLDDVSVSGSSPDQCGIFSIRYSGNASIVQGSNFIGCPPQSHYWRSPDGGQYRIRVEKVAAGYAGGAMWAQVSIFG